MLVQTKAVRQPISSRFSGLIFAGVGSYKRMKGHMHEHVDQVRHTMFLQSTEEVRNRLKLMLRQIEELMANKADEVFMQMSRDYRSVLGGGDIVQEETMPKWQRSMRKDIKAVIESAEKIFKRVAGFKVEDDEIGEDVEVLPSTEAKVEEGGESFEQVKTEDVKNENGEAGSTVFEHGCDVTMEFSEEVFQSAETMPQMEDSANIDVQERNDVGKESTLVAEAHPKSPNAASSPIDSAKFHIAPESTTDAGADPPGADTHNPDTHSGNTTESEDSSVGFESGDSNGSY